MGTNVVSHQSLRADVLVLHPPHHPGGDVAPGTALESPCLHSLLVTSPYPKTSTGKDRTEGDRRLP